MIEDEAPVVEETPVVEEAPVVVEETPIVESAPVVEEAPVVEPEAAPEAPDEAVPMETEATPAAVEPPVAAVPVSTDQWEERWSNTNNKIYYLNVTSTTSQWDKPEGAEIVSLSVLPVRASHLLVKHEKSRRPSSWRCVFSRSLISIERKTLRGLLMMPVPSCSRIARR